MLFALCLGKFVPCESVLQTPKLLSKELQDNDSSKYSEEARAWATSTGLIAGNGEVIDGEPNYMWADILTREQFVTVLYRFAKKMGMV